LLDRYGATELQAGIKEALQRGVPHPNAVRLALERRREARELPPPVEMTLPRHVQDRDTPVQAHQLDSYDQITEVSMTPIETLAAQGGRPAPLRTACTLA